MIAILLSTYNGEHFLREQLDSLFAQTYTDFRLYVRDDNSMDGTLAIIEEYLQCYPNIVLLDSGHNMGAKWSFECLLHHAQADYYMFCDQDDVWLPDKIEISLSKIKQMEQQYGDVPLLVHTDLMVVDQDMNIIDESFWRYSNIQPWVVDRDIYDLGIANSVTGCTVIINEAAKQVSLPFHDKIFMHDAWVALCVKKYGQIDYIAVPTMLYRQHMANAIGAIKDDFSIKRRLFSLKDVYARNKAQYMNAHPLVFKNVFHYILKKILFTYQIHYRKTK